jgi:hypothetical protein
MGNFLNASDSGRWCAAGKEKGKEKGKGAESDGVGKGTGPFSMGEATTVWTPRCKPVNVVLRSGQNQKIDAEDFAAQRAGYTIIGFELFKSEKVADRDNARTHTSKWSLASPMNNTGQECRTRPRAS